MLKACTTCGAPLCRQNKSGFCKPHWQEHTRSPEWRARVSRTQRLILFERPELKAKRQEVGRRMAYLPQTMEARRRCAREIGLWKLGLAASTPESRKLAGRNHSENRLAWCPPELRDEYRELVIRHRVKAVDARVMILEQHEKNMREFRRSIGG